jgi:two-component system KDP operon response regulator KdpE
MNHVSTVEGTAPNGAATSRTRVLVVDDEPQLLRALRINLAARHYDVDTAADGTTALQTAATRTPDLVVLDLGLPDMDGVDVIHALRARTAVPIVVLSGRAGSSDKVHALDAGADDYVTKPFSLDELLARIRAVTRRTGGTPDATVTIGRHRISLADRTIQTVRTVERPADGQPPRLTRTEWQLLEILAANPGKLMTQPSLLQQVWGTGYESQTHYLRQYMGRLRRKLEDNPAHPRHLLTEPGMGYRFSP